MKHLLSVLAFGFDGLNASPISISPKTTRGHMMNRTRVSVAVRWAGIVSLLTVALAPSTSLGQTTYEFTPIATSADGFADLGWPRMNNHGVVAFPGKISGQWYTYKGDGSSRTLIGYANSFVPASINDNGQVAFGARIPTPSIFVGDGESAEPVWTKTKSGGTSTPWINNNGVVTISLLERNVSPYFEGIGVGVVGSPFRVL